MRKASTRLLEQGIQVPSPAPDLIPAETKTSTENLHWDWYSKRGHFSGYRVGQFCAAINCNPEIVDAVLPYTLFIFKQEQAQNRNRMSKCHNESWEPTGQDECPVSFLLGLMFVVMSGVALFGRCLYCQRSLHGNVGR